MTPEPGSSPTYASYLHLDELLELQVPRSSPPHPDELHFIITHQAMELWFKVIVHEVIRVNEALMQQRWPTAVLRLKRVNDILVAQTRQMATLQHLLPKSFLDFRGLLGTASGFQSEQFRVIEVLSGLRDEEHLAFLAGANNGELPGGVDAALTQPSMAQIAESLPRLAWEGVTWEEAYAHPDQFDTLVLVGEQLLEYDRLWMEWRFGHIVLVERVLGRKVRGTGGTMRTYLDSRLPQRFFPFLWDVRHDLSQRPAVTGRRPVGADRERAASPEPDRSRNGEVSVQA